MTPRLCIPCLLVAAACGPGKPDEDDNPGDTSSASTTATGNATATSTPTTSDTTTTSGTTTPLDPTATSDSTSTSSTSTGFESTTGTPMDCRGLPAWQPGHDDCLLDWPTMTQIHGEGPAADLTPTTKIFLGVYFGDCTSTLRMAQLALGDPAAPQAILSIHGFDCGPDHWLGDHLVEGRLTASNTPIAATMTVDGFAGDWFGVGPSDPPRILGSFTGDLVGPFEAVHCGALDTWIESCG